MACVTDRAVALLSIHPNFAEAILSGKKLIELRKRIPSKEIAEIIIYATAPKSAIIGKFEVKGMLKMAPRSLWKQHNPKLGVTKSEFESYFRGKDIAFGYEIGNIHAFRKPIYLSQLSSELVPPRDFCYLDNSMLQLLALISA
jgi:predicted transcriptional regulator